MLTATLENFLCLVSYLAKLALKKFDLQVEVWQNRGSDTYHKAGCYISRCRLSGSLFSGFNSLLEDFGNHKAPGVFALKGQVIDCSVAYPVSDCILCSELICSLWCIADMSSSHCLRRKAFSRSCVFLSIFVLQISPKRN